MKWFKENWGMDKNSGWIKFYKDMEEMFADPIVDDGEQDTVDINTICTPQRPELDLKWKYCGFYTPLAKELGEEEAGHDHGITDLYKMEVLPHAFTFFSVVDIESKAEDASGVTIKFFFNYPLQEDFSQVKSKEELEDANFVEKLYDNLIAQALEPSRRDALRSASKLPFIPRVANLTSGDDLSQRVFWEDNGIDIRINEKDPFLCPEGKHKYENCQSMEIWVPEINKEDKN